MAIPARAISGAAVLGAFCFPGTGHLNPFTALARRLQQRGHRVIIFGIADIEARVRAAGIEFRQIGVEDYPLGTLKQLDDKLSRLRGLETFRFTVERVRNHARMVLRDGPFAVKAAGVDAMLVDEADMAGSVAEHLGLPFVSIACFPPLMWNAAMPPFCFGWGFGAGPFARMRNVLGFKLLSHFAAPIFDVVNAQRQMWGLKPYARSTDALSPLAQIAQIPEALEFPIPNRPGVSALCGTAGGWCRSCAGAVSVGEARRAAAGLRLDGHHPERVGVYLQGYRRGMLDARLPAGALDGREPRAIRPWFAGRRSHRRALCTAVGDREAGSVVVTHAGLNTTLESLAEGVPLVAIPQGNDQPGVAARIAHHGAGVVVPLRKLSAKRLHRAIKAVLTEESYRSAARRIQAAMREVDAVGLAADVIEEALGLRTGPQVAGEVTQPA